jgi:maltokinase
MPPAGLLVTPAQQRDLAELLAAWLPERRWFAGKGRAITALRLSEVATLPGEVAVAHVVVGVQLDGRTWQVYQVPLSLYADPHPGMAVIGQLERGDWVHDALTDPAAVPALLAASGTHAQVDPDRTHGLEGSSGAHPKPLLQAVDDPDGYRGLPVRPLGVEQSNTSLVLGDVALVKFFRQLVPGVNPDIEVHASLGVARCAHVGRCLGWVNAGWRDPADGQWVTGHTAMVQELLSPAVEGRDLALDRVAAGKSFADDALELGRATGAVHADLRQVLPTHVLTPGEVDELADRLAWRLDQAAAVVEGIAAMRPALAARIDALRTLDHPLEVQRVHGDLHLQQVMRTGSGWKLLDFEGEPGSSMAARVALDHPLRDVAGMLRSFAYAAAQGGADRDPDEVAQWLRDCEVAFLAGYAAAGLGSPGEEGVRADRVILSAYLVDKAAYEAVYERRNRPDWLPIPMAALAELAG